MRARKYQDGGRVDDLLRMLEQQNIQKEAQKNLFPSLSWRLPPPLPMTAEPSAASSTSASMRPIKSLDDANMAAALSGMKTLYGRDYEPFDPASGHGVKMIAPIAETLSPVGDISAMAEAENFPQFALAAGMAILPGNARTLREWVDWNVSPSNLNTMNKLLDKLVEPKSADEIISENAHLFNIPQWRRDELAFDLEDMYREHNMFIENPGELDKIQEMADILRSGKIPKVNAPDQSVPDIGDFVGETDPANGLIVKYESSKNPMEYMDVVESAPNSNEYIINVIAPKSSPLTRGKLIMAGIEKIPVGGKISFVGDEFGIANTMSADAYPMMFRFFKRGKAEPILDSVEYGRLNSLGENPDLFAGTFGIDKADAIKIGSNTRIDDKTINRVLPKINSKLAEYGIPPARLTDKSENGSFIEFPYFDILRTAEGFKNGGSLRVLKMRGGGRFRVKKY